MRQTNRSELLGTSSGRQVGNTAAVSHPWRLQFDDEYQAHFYYNPQTGESKWAEVENGGDYDVPIGAEEHGSGQYAEEEYDFDEIDGNSVSNMSRMSTMSVVERSAQMLAQKKEKQDALRHQLEQRELDALRSGPEINHRSKQLNRNVDDIFAWEERRKAKMEALAAQVRAEEDARITGRPHLYAPMTGSSASVYSGSSAQSADSDSLPVEARLLAYEEKRKLKLQQAIAHEKNEARKAATPTLAPHSANLNRRREAQQSSQSSVADSQADSVYSSYRASVASGSTQGILRDNSTGQIMFQPKINKRSEQMAAQSRPAIPVEDLLTGKGQLQKQRLQERERRQEQKVQQLSETPKVNPKSEKLVQERYILQGETTSDRLARPIGNVKAKVLDEIEQPTFRPTLNPVSVEIATSNNGYYNLPAAAPSDNSRNTNQPYSPQEDSFDRFDSMLYNDEQSINDGPLLYEDYLRSAGKSHRGGGSAGGTDRGAGAGSSLYNPSQSLAAQGAQGMQDIMYQKTQRWEEMRQAKLDKGRRERERQQAAQCTFKPQIDPRSRNIAYENDREEDSGSNAIDSYLERQLSWVEKREQKLEIERQKAAMKEVEGCSFAPQLRGGSAKVRASGAVTGASGAGTERSTRSQGSLLGTTAAGKSTNKHAKWADEGPYFVNGNPAEFDAEQGNEYENDIDQQVRAYYGDHTHTQEQGYLRYRDPETAEEHQPEQDETPMRRIPLPQRAAACTSSSNNNEYSIVPNVRFNLPEEGTTAGGGFTQMQTAPIQRQATRPVEGTNEDEVPPGPGRMKVPLPAKSVPPVARGATSTVFSASAGSHGTIRSGGVQPTTISVRVPASSTGYEDSEYVDYEPSPSSGVMLARSAPSNLHRRNVHFSATWEDQDALYADTSTEHADEYNHTQPPQVDQEQHQGFYEDDDENGQNAHYNGLPFHVDNANSKQRPDRITPTRAGANMPSHSPPYQQSPENSAPPYARSSQLQGGTSHQGQGQERLLYGTQHHRDTAPVSATPATSCASYSFVGLAEPEDHEYGNLSLFDVGQLDFDAHHADTSNGADEFANDFAPPPPPPPSDEVEWTEPHVRGQGQQTQFPREHARMTPARGHTLPATSTSTPLHRQHQYAGAARPASSNVYDNNEQDEYGYGDGMEYSPSPAKYAYDIL